MTKVIQDQMSKIYSLSIKEGRKMVFQQKIDSFVITVFCVSFIIFKRINTHMSSTLNNFLPIAKIGQGTFSSVYQVKRVTDQKVYALKKIKIANLKEKQRANALNQVRILASLTSNFIISYKESFFDQKLHLLCIVMEWANEGDLHQKVKSYKERRHKFPEEEIWKAAYQILSGLYTLHRNSILHRDMKSANVFISDGIYKLGDLNVSKIKDHQNMMAQTQTGTPFYASPQIWRDQPYGIQSDIWSYGCIIYEMCCLQPPFNGRDLGDLNKYVQRGRYEPIPKTYSRELSKLIERCLSHKARDRPTAQDLLKDGGVIRDRCEFYEIATDKVKSNNFQQRLLKTIDMPFDMTKLNSKLPDSQYQKPKIIQEMDKHRTITKTSQSNLSLSHNKNEKINNPSSYSNQKELQILQSQMIGLENHQRESLPQKIKNQLNKINRLVHEKDGKQYRPQKQKVLSAVQSSIGKQRQKKAYNFLSPVKEYPSRKQRPLSCNHVNLNKYGQKSPYYINNLKRNNPSMDLMYLSDRKPMAGLRQRSDVRSDRREGLGDLRDPYQLQKMKYRCRSANMKPISLLSDMKHSLQMKYSHKKSSKLTEVKSEVTLKHQKSNYGLPNSQIYCSPVINKDYHKYRKNEPSYLQQVQTKIYANAGTRLKRSEHYSGIRLGERETRIRRLVKGTDFYTKSTHHL